jgi:hypothetical protein
MAELPELWRHVQSNLKAMEEHAPDGYTPVMRVLVAGRPEPLEVASYEGREGVPWIFFASARSGDAEDADPDEGHPDDVFLFVNAAAIQGIELAFRRTSKARIGFPTYSVPPTSAS